MKEAEVISFLIRCPKAELEALKRIASQQDLSIQLSYFDSYLERRSSAIGSIRAAGIAITWRTDSQDFFGLVSARIKGDRLVSFSSRGFVAWDAHESGHSVLQILEQRACIYVRASILRSVCKLQ
jgi:hypothetical protein